MNIREILLQSIITDYVYSHYARGEGPRASAVRAFRELAAEIGVKPDVVDTALEAGEEVGIARYVANTRLILEECRARYRDLNEDGKDRIKKYLDS